MKHLRNIPLSQQQDQKIQQAEGGFKWVIVAFVGFAWLCRSVTHDEPHARLIDASYHQPGSTLGLISEWFE